MERHTAGECKAVLVRAEELGINILDCWMSNPEVRTSLGLALAGRRERWYIQGHICSTWQDGQYVRTRDVDLCRAAFEDLLARLQTDYIDLGMIHFVDTQADWDGAMGGPFLDYVKQLKALGTIRHIGMSTHNPAMAKKAVECGYWHLYRYDPRRIAEGKNPFQLDSPEPDTEKLMDFLMGENRFASLKNNFPGKADALYTKEIADVKARYAKYRKMAED